MDIKIDIGEYKLNMRAAAIIMHNEKILVHKDINCDYYALIGGRIKIGENSRDAIKREVLEEIGKEIKTTEYIATIENFFKSDNTKYHEILFVYKAEFIDEEDRKIENTLKNIEGEDKIQYEWIKLDEINKYKIYPKEIKEILLENKFPVHKINNNISKKGQYYENTKNIMPNENVREFIQLKTKGGKAIELGCGAGRDTKYLIENGWNVTAIDKEDVEEIITEKLSRKEKAKFKFEKQEFENIELTNCDLIVANYSLPFCERERFDEMWDKIKTSICPNGYFVGNFFGLKDEWRKTEKDIMFLSKENILNLFDDFKIIRFKEIEKEMRTGLGTMKHWHLFLIIAQKK